MQPLQVLYLLSVITTTSNLTGNISKQAMSIQKTRRSKIFELVTLDKGANKEVSHYETLTKQTINTETVEGHYMTPMKKKPCSTDHNDDASNLKMNVIVEDEVMKYDSSSNCHEAKKQLGCQHISHKQEKRQSNSKFQKAVVAAILTPFFLISFGSLVFAAFNFKKQMESQGETNEMLQRLMKEMSQQAQNNSVLMERVLSLERSFSRSVNMLETELNETQNEVEQAQNNNSVLMERVLSLERSFSQSVNMLETKLSETQNEVESLSSNLTQLMSVLSGAINEIGVVASNYTDLSIVTSNLVSNLNAFKFAVTDTYSELSGRLYEATMPGHCTKEVKNCTISDPLFTGSMYVYWGACTTEALPFNETVSSLWYRVVATSTKAETVFKILGVHMLGSTSARVLKILVQDK